MLFRFAQMLSLGYNNVHTLGSENEMSATGNLLAHIVGKRRREILRVAAMHRVRDVRVFGSVARGEAKPGSDLDLLVKLDPETSLLDLIAFKQDLEDMLGCQVDVLTEASVSPYIRDQVLQEAIRL